MQNRSSDPGRGGLDGIIAVALQCCRRRQRRQFGGRRATRQDPARHGGVEGRGGLLAVTERQHQRQQGRRLAPPLAGRRLPHLLATPLRSDGCAHQGRPPRGRRGHRPTQRSAQRPRLPGRRLLPGALRPVHPRGGRGASCVVAQALGEEGQARANTRLRRNHPLRSSLCQLGEGRPADGERIVLWGNTVYPPVQCRNSCLCPLRRCETSCALVQLPGASLQGTRRRWRRWWWRRCA
mmetsp:Transcript_104116/g.269580  ORF Transcript_104116/g.269580 Transcript_104116/m.269580 type:complete len:237 (-) Transcript_104116:1647-2357(-)